MTREELLAELRPFVADDRVLEALAAVPRELFVAPSDRRRAWENRALGIACGQTISQPLVVARMCEALAIAPGTRALDVGTGSGYHAAVMATLGASVVSVEIVPELSASAAANLAAAGIDGVRLVVGDGREGFAGGAPYDAICVAATADDDLPAALIDQLAPRGRLVAPVRSDRHERLVVVSRKRDGALTQVDFDEVRFVPLV